MHSTKNQSGMTLIGVMFAIVIGLIVTGAIYGLYNNTTTASKANSDAQAVLSMRQGIQSIFPSGDYNGLTNQLLIKTKHVPDAIAYGTNVLRGATGDVIDVASTGGSANQFRVRVSTSSKASCTILANTAQGAFYKVIIRHRVVKDDGLTFNNAATTAACKTGTARVEFYGK